MWLLAAAIFFGCKWLTWRQVSCSEIPWRLQCAFLLAWPGMDAAGFLESRNGPRCAAPSGREWSFAIAKTLLGVALICGAARQVPEEYVLLRGWVGLVGLAFVLHFGTFHILSCGWRRLGRDAKPLMNWPLLGTSVADFWGRRWNLAFRDLTHRFLFQPLTRI
jgi:hypothetical protein